MQKNTASQKWIVFAYGLPSHSTPGLPVTGDAANITANLRLDGGAANAVDDTNPTELEDGYYVFDITAAESNANSIVIAPVSATSDVQVIGVPGAVYTTPASFNSSAIATASALATVSTVVDGIQTDLSNGTDGLGAIKGDTAAIKTKTDSLTFTTANQVDSNALAISSDTAAADNLEAMYDGTGYGDTTGPASRGQVAFLATGTASISTVAVSRTLTTGTEVNSVTDTHTLNAIEHEISDDGGAFEMYYEFNVGGSGVGVETTMVGRLNGVNDTLGVFAYNWGLAAWDEVGSIIGNNGSNNETALFNLLISHTGTGLDLGKVRVRGFAASGLVSATLFLDQVFVSYAIVSNSVGYAMGAIWIDTMSGVSGVEPFVNGTADNPVLTLANAVTLSSSTNIPRFVCSPDSSITFTETHADQVWSGDGWTLALGGQDVSQTHIYHCNDVSGVATSPSGEVHILDSHVGNITLGACHFTDCLLSGTFTLGLAADYTFEKCSSGIAGATSPIIDMAGVGASNVAIRGWHGGITINNLATGDVLTLDGTFGTVTLNGADANVEIRGIAKAVVNNLTGSPTVNDNSIKSSVLDAILLDTGTDGVVLAGTPDVNMAQISTSANAADNLGASALAINSTTVASGSSETVFTLTAGAANNDTYIGRVVLFTSGSLDGEGAEISDYVGSTKTVTLLTALTAAPTNESLVIV